MGGRTLIKDIDTQTTPYRESAVYEPEAEVSSPYWVVENDPRGIATLLGTAPEIRLSETDQTDPAGRWRRQVTGDTYNIDRAASTEWASSNTYQSISNAGAHTLQHVDASTNTVLTALILTKNTTGTPANNLGVGLDFQVETSTTENTQAAAIDVLWTTGTHATRTSDMVFYNVQSGTITEMLRLDGSANYVKVQGSTDLGNIPTLYVGWSSSPKSASITGTSTASYSIISYATAHRLTSATSGLLVGVVSSPRISGDNTQNWTRTPVGAAGFWDAALMLNTTGTLTGYAGFYSSFGTTAWSGLVTNGYGFYFENPTAPTGTLTNLYGTYIEKVTRGATLNYGIYIAGASTAAIYVAADSVRLADSVVLGLGTGTGGGAPDATLTYNGTNVVLDPAVIGAGVIVVGSGEAGGIAGTGTTLRVPDLASGSNLAGTDLIIAAGLGRGVGNVGTIIFDLPIVGTTGENPQTRATRLTLDMVASTAALTMLAAQAMIIRTGAGDLTLSPTDDVDINANTLKNVGILNLTDPTELTIVSGAITVTQGWHTVDTEGDAASDYLDTINGGTTGDELIVAAAHTDRTIIIRNQEGNIGLNAENETRAFGFNSPAGAAGIFYAAGFYRAPAADANLTQASTTVNYGSANIAYGAHAFIVAAAAGSVDAGTVSIVVSGTSVDDSGVRTATDTETIVADITAMTTNAYYETVLKWIGTITFTLTPAGATTYNADFNYGLCKYDDFGNQHFHLTDFECVGRAGANDTGFNIRLLYHSSAGWTYSAAAFVPGGTELANMNTTYNTEVNLSNGEPFAYKRDDLSQEIDGDTVEGIVVEITTGANKAVDRMDIQVQVHTVPKSLSIDSTEESIKFIYNGSCWCEI